MAQRTDHFKTEKVEKLDEVWFLGKAEKYPGSFLEENIIIFVH